MTTRANSTLAHSHGLETATTYRVSSEVGQLREAIIHRPGLELSRLTPDTIKAVMVATLRGH